MPSSSSASNSSRPHCKVRANPKFELDWHDSDEIEVITPTPTPTTPPPAPVTAQSLFSFDVTSPRHTIPKNPKYSGSSDVDPMLEDLWTTTDNFDQMF